MKFHLATWPVHELRKIDDVGRENIKSNLFVYFVKTFKSENKNQEVCRSYNLYFKWNEILDAAYFYTLFYSG